MVREANTNDITALYNLGKKMHDNFEETYDLLQIFNNSFNKILIWEEDEVIAFLHYTVLYENVDIVNIFVDETYRQKNIATRLFEEMINRIPDGSNITLEVNENNFPAIKLYKKFGFKNLAIRKQYYGKDNGILMGRSKNMKNVNILAIESSCDETSMAIIQNGTKCLALTVLSQIDVHSLYGGVVPEIASRMHTESITVVYEETLKKANLTMDEIDAIAVTAAPGLLGSLLVGVEFAKTISFIYKKPLIAVDHIAGHIYANNLENEMEFPLLALVVSGGHTNLILMEGDYKFKIIGSTLDDAIGETYDKVARVLDLKYPGGPNIEKLAKEGKPSYDLPVSMKDDSLNFSFSGLKSSIINLVHNETQRNNEINKADLACSFQTVAIEQIRSKVDLALQRYNVKHMIIAGGVSANNYLREEIRKVTEKHGVNLTVPAMKYCTDNAAMIGAAAYPLYKEGKFADLTLNASSLDTLF